MRSVSVLAFYIITSILPLAGQIPDPVKYQSLEPYDFHLWYLRSDSSVLIDVREPFEFRGKRIRDAVNIPSSGNIEKAADTLNREFAYFLYCTTDYRSRNAAEILYEKGFRKLYNLEGGIVAWRKDGMPVVKGRIRLNKTGLK
jgi:rhodanese-related sulfurtransferase